MALITPLYDLKTFPDVYEPSEDSFLFLDALEIEMEFIKELRPNFVAEIGSGSGVIISALATTLKNNTVCFATDINPQACLATTRTAKLNNVTLEVLNMNLLDCFENTFDMILFNPPYVVTEASECYGCGLNRAWAGGNEGREVLDEVLSKLPSILSLNGVFYSVVLKENRPENILKMMSGIGFNSEKIIERKIRGEHLFVYKFIRCK